MSRTVVELAQQILEDAKVYERHFSENKLPPPSFGPESFPEPLLPPDIRGIRESLSVASTELQRLVAGPAGIVVENATHSGHFLALQAIYRYELVDHIPSEGAISYVELSKKCHLAQSEVKRVLRYAMSCHMFHEPEPEHVAHNGASKALAETYLLKQWFGMVMEEIYPAASRTVDAMQKWPGSSAVNQAGWQLANNTSNHVFTEFSSNPQRAQRFADAMSLFSHAPGMEVARIVDTFPWGELKDGNFTFVDVGGSQGTVDIALARAFPEAKFIVQDILFSNSEVRAPDDLQGQLTFVEHDFFKPQPVQADIYFFRWIFHDWPDSNCLQILRALIPALKPGAKVIVNEFCLPKPGQVDAHHDRILRSFDLVMLSLQNSKERDLDDWKNLFTTADERFKFEKAHMSKGSPMALIEFSWSG